MIIHKLKKFVVRYNALCELICNNVLAYKFKVALNTNSWLNEKQYIKLAIEEYINKRDEPPTKSESRI